jgi:hypothetical protein
MKGPRPKLFSFQNDLPRLPVPDLKKTLDRYLRSVRALATDEEYANTEKIVATFLAKVLIAACALNELWLIIAIKGGEGESLQQMLLDHSDREWKAGRSWLENWWFEFAYLRWPVECFRFEFVLCFSLNKSPLSGSASPAFKRILLVCDHSSRRRPHQTSGSHFELLLVRKSAY